jgi:hypothetical protein
MTVTFKLERLDGTPADPPSFETTVLVGRPGDTIPLGANRAFRVVEVGNDDPRTVHTRRVAGEAEPTHPQEAPDL